MPPSSSPIVTPTPWQSEARAVLRLATPVIIVQIGNMLMGTVDTMMLGRVSKEALAAGALGNAVGFGLMAPAMGLLMALDPLVAQAHGAGDRARVGRHVARALVLVVVLSALSISAIVFFAPRLDLLGQTSDVAPLAARYLYALTPGVPGFLLYFLIRQVLQAMSVVRPAIVAVVVANIVNVLANWCLVFGAFGFPRLEVLGSGLATSISRWSLLLVLLLASVRLRRRLGVDLRVRRGNWRETYSLRRFGEFLRLGVPVSLHVSAEFWVFSTVALIMGTLGAVQFAGHQISINVASLTFMVPMGIAGAAATRVGNAIGRGDRPGMLRSAITALGLGAAVMACAALVLGLLPRELARLYSPQEEVIAAAALLLPIAAVFQVVDGLQVVSSGVLRGAADTTWPAALALFGFWAVGLPFGWWLCFARDLGPEGLWWGLTVGLAVTAALLLARTRGRLRQPLERLLAEADE